jgi:hypothetical protein
VGEPLVGERLGEVVELTFHGAGVQAWTRITRDQQRTLQEVELVVSLRGVSAKIHYL